MEMISAIIITKDEEKMIKECLTSLDFVDEIIVIDTGSTDQTNAIAKKHKARVEKYSGVANFASWRNFGLKKAKGEWVLYIDADERITPGLKKEILTQITNSLPADRKDQFSGYALPRRNIILGKELKHGGWYPDYVKRLYKKTALKGWSGDLHEEPIFAGDLGHLKNDLLHVKHETFFEMVEKTNKWSAIEAKLMFDAKHPPMNLPRFITAMGREFWHRMIVKRAYLDGKVGIMFALYQVFSRFVSYAKLWEMQNTSHRSLVTSHRI